MKPQTCSKQYDIGRILPVQCVKNDMLKDLEIKDSCFLLMFVREGVAYFQVGDTFFEAIAPCFVCFDEMITPKLIRKKNLYCDSIYFKPIFLNVNMTFARVRGSDYTHIALHHDMFLLKPFTDNQRFVFPVINEYVEKISMLFSALNKELSNQNDWYWSCRSRSYFIEILLLLERTYGLIGHTGLESVKYQILNPYLKNAVVYIESHYCENINLGSIVKAVALNHSTLTQLFKNELNMTPVEYLWHYRIAVAKQFLEFTELPIKDIALRCGFKTIQHFSRKFEEVAECTPSLYRTTMTTNNKIQFL